MKQSLASLLLFIPLSAGQAEAGKGNRVREIVEKILENSKQIQNSPSPRQLFYRQFDATLRLVQQDKTSIHLEAAMGKMEHYGKVAQIPAGEIAHRKMTLLWTLANA